MPGISSSNVLRFRTSQPSCNRWWTEARDKRATAKRAKSSSRAGEASFGIARTEGGAAPQYTTAEMVRLEKEIISRMQEGNRREFRDPTLVSPELRTATEIVTRS